MQCHVRPDIQIMDLVGPVLVATLYIAACSFFREPKRKNFNAIMIAGASAAPTLDGAGSQLAVQKANSRDEQEFGGNAGEDCFAARGYRRGAHGISATAWRDFLPFPQEPMPP